MIVNCQNCGKKYERFNTGGYQEEEPHKCNKTSLSSKVRTALIEATSLLIIIGMIPILTLLALTAYMTKNDEELAKESWTDKT